MSKIDDALPPHHFIAGGFLRDSLLGISPTEVDLFYSENYKDTMLRAMQWCFERGMKMVKLKHIDKNSSVWYHDILNVRWVKRGSLMFDMFLLKDVRTDGDMIRMFQEEFDFTVNTFWRHHCGDAGSRENARRDLDERQLSVIQSLDAQHDKIAQTLDILLRAQMLHKRGWIVSPDTILWMSRAFARLPLTFDEMTTKSDLWSKISKFYTSPTEDNYSICPPKLKPKKIWKSLISLADIDAIWLLSVEDLPEYVQQMVKKRYNGLLRDKNKADKKTSLRKEMFHAFKKVVGLLCHGTDDRVNDVESLG